MAAQDAGNKKIDDDLIGGHHSFEAKDFFGDKKRGHRMGCTCLTLIILLIVAMISVGTVIYLAGKSNGFVKVTDTSQVSSAQDSLASQLEDSVAGKNDKNVIIISENDLVSLLPSASMDIVIKPENVFVTTKYLNFDVLMEVEPYINEGQLRFKIKSAKLGALPLPGFLMGPVTAGFGNAVNNLSKELSVITLEAVEKQEGRLVLTGKVVGR